MTQSGDWPGEFIKVLVTSRFPMVLILIGLLGLIALIFGKKWQLGALGRATGAIIGLTLLCWGLTLDWHDYHHGTQPGQQEKMRPAAMPRLLSDEGTSPLLKVLAITPSESFGPLQLKGLQAALEEVPDLRLLSCQATLADMKAGRALECEALLRQELGDSSLVAIVGPGVSEEMPRVAEALRKSRVQVPLFVLSAVSRSSLQWDRGDIPLFRISSGADERADELVGMARRLLKSHTHIVLLVESAISGSATSYGESIEELIKIKLSTWQADVQEGRILVIRYPTGQIQAKLQELQGAFAKRQVIFLLGLGGDYRVLANAFYRVGSSSEPPHSARLVGWMTAYAMDQLYHVGHYRWDCLYDITDIDISERTSRVADNSQEGRFRRTFGDVNPAMRDQAFAFDVGLCLSRALDDVRAARAKALGAGAPFTRRDLLATLVGGLYAHDIEGVTGHIDFDTRIHGQNAGTPLQLCTYDGNTRRWVAAPFTRLTSP